MTHSMKLIAALVALVFAPILVVFANGGDQRVVEGKYLINLARSPFTPKVGVETSMVISFADVQTNTPIKEDLIVRVRIAKLAAIGTAERAFVFERDNMRVSGGVLELPYTFKDPGLHEIFVDFAFASDPQRLYQASDFLMDVQGTPDRTMPLGFTLLPAALVGGFIAGWFLRGRTTKP